MPELTVEGVSKRFGALRVVDDVSLAVSPGERRAIIGPNGAGKTTLFNLISGDLKVTGGRVALGGDDITTWSASRRARAGLRRTYQSSAVFDSLTVEENVAVAALGPSGGTWKPLAAWDSGPAVRETVERVLAELNLVEVRHTHAADLSHGERRQLEIGMASATSPRILLLDEPAAGLSEAERITLVSLIRGFSKEITILMIEHDMRIALGFADTVTVLANGKLIAQGSPSEITSNELVQQAYLGEAHREQ